MKEYLSYCARCDKECPSLELTKGLCQNCVTRLKFSIDPAYARAKDTTVEVVQKHCSSCEHIWAFVQGEEKANCPTCGVSYTAPVITRQEKNKVAIDDNNRKVMDQHIKKLELDIDTQEKELSQLKATLETLKLVRGMMK